MARSLDYGHRYIVALRNMKDSQGNPIDAGAAFRIYRDNHASALSFVNERRAHIEELFASLGRLRALNPGEGQRSSRTPFSSPPTLLCHGPLPANGLPSVL